MTPSDRTRRRPGHALLLVVGYLMVLLTVWGVAFRSVASAYRVETVRSARQSRDEGTMTALGRALALLRTGTPKHEDGSDLVEGETYRCYIRLDTRTGPRWFAATYTREADPETWSARAEAVEWGGLPLMPETFEIETTTP